MIKTIDINKLNIFSFNELLFINSTKQKANPKHVYNEKYALCIEENTKLLVLKNL